MKIRLSGTADDSIVDGLGLRFTIFTQGCPHHCVGCHNPQTHSQQDGYETDTDVLLQTILDNPLLDGITLSGGEPFLQAEACADLAKKVQAHGLNVWTYTGFVFEELIQSPLYKSLLSYTNILVDGRFEIENRSLTLQFCGSSNQRVIDVKKSLREGVPIKKEIL